MDFGRRRLPVRLQAARGIAWCQAIVLVLIALSALGIMAVGGASFVLSGIASHTTITGAAVATFAFLYLAAAVAVVAVEREVVSRGDRALLALVATEVVLSVYMIVFVDAAPGGWVFGPIAGAAIIALHGSARPRHRSSPAGGVTPPPPSAPGRAPGGAGPDAASPPHL
ncbi:MAG: hypothetical protein ACLQT7_11810 [Candidatus Dormibacteria bacterium]